MCVYIYIYMYMYILYHLFGIILYYIIKYNAIVQFILTLLIHMPYLIVKT